MQHRKAVTLDTAVWPFSDTRVDKLEKDVDGIRGDVAEIKQMVKNPTGQTREEDDNGDRDVDADSTHSTPQNDVVSDVMEKDGELTKLRTEIVHDKREIDELTEKFTQEMHNLQLRHNAMVHEMTTQVEEKEIHAHSLSAEIQNKTAVQGMNMTGLSSTASQYCVNLTR